MPIQKIDLTGRKFGRLTVVGFSHMKRTLGGKRYWYWTCQCECGNTSIVSRTHLYDGHIKSCGCWRREENPELFYNDIRVTYKSMARKRELVFDLTLDDFRRLCSGDCHYCGCPPSAEKRRKPGGAVLLYNGIDRVNNDIGYLLDNCVTCCSLCNMAKRQMSRSEFIELCTRIVHHLQVRM